jgi:hypothetical protein
MSEKHDCLHSWGTENEMIVCGNSVMLWNKSLWDSTGVRAHLGCVLCHWILTHCHTCLFFTFTNTSTMTEKSQCQDSASASSCRVLYVVWQWISAFVKVVFMYGAHGSIVVEALHYKPEGRVFDSWCHGFFFNLPNPSSCIMPWGLLNL